MACFLLQMVWPHAVLLACIMPALKVELVSVELAKATGKPRRFAQT